MAYERHESLDPVGDRLAAFCLKHLIETLEGRDAPNRPISEYRSVPPWPTANRADADDADDEDY